MKVLVTGGRNYFDRHSLFCALDATHQAYGITKVIEGGAFGADRIAREWAQKRGVSYIEYRADWKKHGKNAGPIRNREMAEKENPDVVIACPGGRGTKNMKSIARELGIVVWEV